MAEASQALQEQVRAACGSARYSHAAALVVRGLGDEIGRYLGAVVRTGPQDVAEVFSQWCEDVLRGLPGFAFAASLRTWCYTLARHAAARAARSRRRRDLRIALPGELEDQAAAVRTRTVRYLQTEVKDRLARVREQLTEPERELLALRVDRQLPWREIAEILAEPDHQGAQALGRFEQALRKRFETLARRLRVLLAERDE